VGVGCFLTVTVRTVDIGSSNAVAGAFASNSFAAINSRAANHSGPCVVGVGCFLTITASTVDILIDIVVAGAQASDSYSFAAISNSAANHSAPTTRGAFVLGVGFVVHDIARTVDILSDIGVAGASASATTITAAVACAT